MSFSFANFFTFAKTVTTGVAAGADELAPVANIIPGGAAIDAAVKGAATIAGEAIDAGEALIAAAAPELSQAIALWDSLFHITMAPGSLILTPKTSVATVPTATASAATVAATQAAS
jgi:hypothetical protein